VVAETAPETSSSADSSRQSDASPTHAGGGQAARNSGGKGQADQRTGSPTYQGRPSSGELPDGSSGLGEVIGEATGSSSSGGPGFLLPLAIVAAIAWALAYLRRRRRPAG
jgi:hypothetical protein